jgi:hypothetical protein|tara:strand:- start:1494 stop:1946 length:453 start_codon:yes stop_codon:yes gene_type:complete
MNKHELCRLIKGNVIKLTHNEITELFKIIKNCNVNYTKNNNGVFLNLNWLSKDNLVKMNNYISFCIKSQNEICKYELMKNLLNTSIDTTNKEDTKKDDSNIIQTELGNNVKQKFSSSMKFYLLKKKFSKQNTLIYNLYDNELKYENYLIT